VNVPIAVLAIVGVRVGIAADAAADLHRDPVDVIGAVLGTATIVLALVAPTLFVNNGPGSWASWTATAAAVVEAISFVLRERSARYPLLDLDLVARLLVSSGLAYKAAAALATAGLGYIVRGRAGAGQWIIYFRFCGNRIKVRAFRRRRNAPAARDAGRPRRVPRDRRSSRQATRSSRCALDGFVEDLDAGLTGRSSTGSCTGFSTNRKAPSTPTRGGQRLYEAMAASPRSGTDGCHPAGRGP